MPSHIVTPLSILQKFKLVFKVFIWLGRVPIEYLRLSFTRTLSTSNWRVTLIDAILRARSHLNFEEQRATTIPTGDSIRAYCNIHKLQLESQEIECGYQTPTATIHTIRLSNGNERLLYFHGGGYGHPLSGPGHLRFIFACAAARKASLVHILEYSLAPEVKFPGQLIQAVCALKTLLQSCSPSNLVLGGDSAGGNLALAILGHVNRPHPAVPILEFEGKFKGVYLLSPWVTMTAEHSSWITNAHSDYLSKIRGYDFIDLWLPIIHRTDPIAAPILGEKIYTQMAAERILITLGTKETLFDGITEFCELVGAVEYPDDHNGVSFTVGKDEIHVHSALQSATNSAWTGTSAVVLEWLSSSI